MSTLRLPFAVVAGAVFSSAVFLALWQFVNAPLNIGEPVKAQRIEFTRQIPDTPPETKRQQKIDRPPPPVVPASTHVGPGDPGTGGPAVYSAPSIPVVPEKFSARSNPPAKAGPLTAAKTGLGNVRRVVIKSRELSWMASR